MAKEPLLQSFGALPWGRWLGEFVIIVVGVLVALAVDSYREDQIDEARERVYLANLYADLTIDAANMGGAIGYSRAGLRQTEALMLLLGMNLDSYIVRDRLVRDGYNRASINPNSYIMKLPSNAKEAELSERGRTDADTRGKFASWPAGIFDIFVPYEATYSTLLSTGDLKIIQRDSLRRSITGYYENIRRSNADASDLGYHIRMLNQFLREHGINPYDPDELARIPEVPGIGAALALARDKHHWWYVRKLGIKRSLDSLRAELAEELKVRNIEVEGSGG